MCLVLDKHHESHEPLTWLYNDIQWFPSYATTYVAKINVTVVRTQVCVCILTLPQALKVDLRIWHRIIYFPVIILFSPWLHAIVWCYWIPPASPRSVTQTYHLNALSCKHLRLISYPPKYHSPCSSVFVLCSVLPYLISSPLKQICFPAPCQSCFRRWSRPLILEA